MKVLHLIHGLNTGGAETLVKEYVLNLNKEIFDVVVICFNHYDNSPYEKLLNDNNIRVIYLDDQIILKNKFGFLARKIKLLHRYYLVRKIIKNENPDIIHSHLLVNNYVKFACPPKKTKLIYTMHGDPERYKQISKTNFNATKWLVKTYNMTIICLHQEMEKKVKEMFDTNNTLIMNNGINIEKFKKVKNKSLARNELKIKDDSFVIGHIGRFNKVKNHIFLINIFYKISKINSKAFLLLIGDGEEKENIISMLHKYKLDKKYLILSNRSDIPDLLNLMDIFVLPSLSEGIPLSIIEAQESRKICVVSNAISNDAIISNLVKKISLDNEEKWIKFITNFKTPNKIKINDSEWDIKKIVKRLEKIYLEGE